MAFYATADLVKAQLRISSEAEQRFRVPALWKKFLDGAAGFVPGYMDVRTSERRTVETNYKKRTARSLTTTGRAHNHTGNTGDSGVLALSWTTYSDPFSQTVKQGDSNVFKHQEQFEDMLMNSIINFAEGLEATATSYLFTNRSGVNVATQEGTFNATQDVFEITITDATNGYNPRAVQITKMIMDLNKYQNMNFVVACDTISYNKFDFLLHQGTANSTNTSFQFSGVTFIHAPGLYALAGALAAPYTDGFWCVVPEGMIAALPWIPVQNRTGLVTQVNRYGQIFNPVDRLNYAFHAYDTRADGSAIGGEKQDVVVQYELSTDAALHTLPVSVAGETVIQAFAFV
jgi:hypothetical protein